MTGVVLETLNIRKLLAFGLCMLLVQLTSFLIGGLLSPSPNSTEQILMSRCVDRSGDVKKWLYVRHFDVNVSGSNCDNLLDSGDLDEVAPDDLGENQLVFIAQFPHPRDGYKLTMTRWFQQILAVLTFDMKHKFGRKIPTLDAPVRLDIRLGYRNRGDVRDVWHELAHSVERRPLRCVLDQHKDPADFFTENSYYDCEVLPLFSLASCHHDEYLLNLRILKDTDNNNGSLSQSGSVLQDVWMVEIHQNGGFTKIWFALKTVAFPCGLLALNFFLHRVRELDRRMTVLEKTILVLGGGLTLLNFPVEWLSLVWNSPFWLILSDVRQGFFLAVLVCFWLIFTGEHMMEEYDRVQRVYWPQLLLVAGSCFALCVFELAERGVQIRNPFYSIWSDPVTAKLGLASVVIGSICALIYMAYLAFLVSCALWQVLRKRRLLVNLTVEQCRYYRGVIYRFTALLAYTLLCASVTVAFFIFSRVTEDQWSWGDRSVEYGSAFITGVYGMWNVYVVAVLCLYAPSHKFRSASGRELYDRLTSTNAGGGAAGTETLGDDWNAASQSCAETVPLHPVHPVVLSPVRSPPTGSGGLKMLRKVALE